ncbi:MAG: SDR family oxidoreductase [Acidobacteria bacterium]|nr:SDR family oxidoreductase [Acidobacteriota bacterium]
MKEKIVVVTGGAAGIFAQSGDRVAVWDVKAADPDALVAELAAAGGEGSFQTVDVTDAAAVETAVAAVVERWGRVDVLVNNAGILRDHQLVKWKDGQNLAEMTERDFDAVVAVNLKGVFLCTRAVAPLMIESGGGSILNASSVVGLYGNFGQTNYAATKAGVISMTKTWARELGRYNVRVNAVAPGFIATEMVTAMPEKVLQGMVSHTPLGRMGRPEDVAEAYFWLASDVAGFITGTVLSVDGGLVVGT